MTFPEIRQPGPKIRRKVCSWRRLQGMDSKRTLSLPSGHGGGSHAEMHLQSPIWCWWEGQGLLRTLPDNNNNNTFSQKRSIGEFGPKIAKIATRLCQRWQPNTLNWRFSNERAFCKEKSPIRKRNPWTRKVLQN